MRISRHPALLNVRALGIHRSCAVGSQHRVPKWTAIICPAAWLRARRKRSRHRPNRLRRPDPGCNLANRSAECFCPVLRHLRLGRLCQGPVDWRFLPRRRRQQLPLFQRVQQGSGRLSDDGSRPASSSCASSPRPENRLTLRWKLQTKKFSGAGICADSRGNPSRYYAFGPRRRAGCRTSPMS